MDSSKPVIIAIAEDDPDDRMMIQDALLDCQILNPVDFLEDGEALMRYLRREHEYAALKGTDLPGLILLDLNLPKSGGMEVLQSIRRNPQLTDTIVVTWTSSIAPH